MLNIANAKKNIIALVIFFIATIYFFYQPIIRNKVPIASDIINSRYPINQEYSPPDRENNSWLGDNILFYYPHHYYISESLKNHNYPIYNSYIFSGKNFYTGTGYIIDELTGFFFGLKSSFLINLLVKMSLAGFFMYLLIRFLSRNWYVSVLGGILWMFNQNQLYWIEFQSHINTQLWLPLVLLLICLLLKTDKLNKKLLYGCALAVVFGIMVSSDYLQFVQYSLLLIFGILASFYLYKYIVHKFSFKKIFASILPIVIALILGFGIGSGLLVDQYIRINQSIRGTQKSMRIPINCNICKIDNFIISTAQFINPLIFGDAVHNDYIGESNSIESSKYFGLLYLLILVFSSVTIKNGRALFFFLTGLLFLLILNGIPPFSTLYYKLPFVSFGGSLRMYAIIAFVWIISLCLYLSSIFRLEKKHFNIFGAVFVSTIMLFSLRNNIFDYFDRLNIESYRQWRYLLGSNHSVNILSLSVALTLVGLVLLYFFSRAKNIKYKNIIFFLLLFTTIFEFKFWFADFNTFSDREKVYPALEFATKINNLSQDGSRIVTKTGSFTPNSNIPYRLETLNGYDTLASNSYIKLLGGEKNLSLTANGFLSDLNLDDKTTREAVDSLSGKYIISAHKLEIADTKIIESSGNRYIYENLSAIPRVFLFSNNTIKQDHNISDLYKINKLAQTKLTYKITGDKTLMNLPDPTNSENGIIVANPYDSGWVFISNKGKLNYENYQGIIKINIDKDVNAIRGYYLPKHIAYSHLVSIIILVLLLSVLMLLYLTKAIPMSELIIVVVPIVVFIYLEMLIFIGNANVK